jgi:hypothetical protein
VYLIWMQYYCRKTVNFTKTWFGTRHWCILYADRLCIVSIMYVEYGNNDIKCLKQWYSLEINKAPKMKPIKFDGAANLFSTWWHIQWTRNQLHRPIANLSRFQKSSYHVGINIFNSLPSSLTSWINKKELFKGALKSYLITHSFYSVAFVMFHK